MFAFTRSFCGGCRRRNPSKLKTAAEPFKPTENEKPVVTRPLNAKYKTVLSIDGGGLRDLIPVMVLIELEKAIKKYILEHKDSFFKDPSKIKTVDDFIIYLADFFDLVAGTSAGSMVATYIASKGKGSGQLIKQQKKPKLQPGSMEVMRIAFFDYGQVLFPPGWWPFLKTLRMLVQSKYVSQDQKNFLDLIVSGQKLSDLETALLVTSYDIEINRGHAFVRTKPKRGIEARSFVVETTVRSDPGTESFALSAGEVVARRFSDWEATETKEDLLLSNISQASSSAPLYFPPTLLTVKDIGKTYRLVDGAVVANNPSLEAVSINRDLSGLQDISKLAVFSVGTGIQYPANMTFSVNPGVYWWLFQNSFYFLDIITEGTSEYVQAVLQSWLRNDFGFDKYQYSRFQVEGTAATFPALSSIDDLSQLEALQKLGEKLAQDNAANIAIFVERFIFAVDNP